MLKGWSPRTLSDDWVSSRLRRRTVSRFIILLALVAGYHSRALAVAGLENTNPTDATTNGVARGTINVFLGNQNGIIALTDSRLTNTITMQPLVAPSPKLFQLDQWSVAAYAGFASEPLRMNPEITSATADIIRGYGHSIKDHPRLTVGEKLSQLIFILQQQLELITAINGDQPDGGQYDLEITVAGYDADGVARIAQAGLGLKSAKPYYLVDATPPQATIVRGPLTSVVRGIPEIANDILSNPAKYDEPMVARYTDARKPNRTALSLDEMEQLARFLAHKTAEGTPFVGGPDQIIVLQSGQVTSREGPTFTEPPPYKKRFSIAWEGILENRNRVALGKGPLTWLFINNQFRNDSLLIDGAYFFGNTFTHCAVEYNGGGVRFAGGGNDVAKSKLLLGPHVDRNSPEVQGLLNLPWREVQFAAPLVPERPLGPSVN